jgi:hypothetical protein
VGQLPEKHFVFEVEQMRKESQGKEQSHVRKYERNGQNVETKWEKTRKREYIRLNKGKKTRAWRRVRDAGVK